MSTSLPPDSASLPVLDARTLRGLGEHADSYRDVEMVVAARETTPGRFEFAVQPADAVDTAGGFAPVMRVVTPSTVVGPPAPPTVSIAVDGVAVDPATLGDVDAIFWTQAAVEKFLFPYYEQMRIFEPAYLQQIKDDYYDKVRTFALVAPVHIFPSRCAVLVGTSLSVSLNGATGAAGATGASTAG